jgi:Mrp family chromosome partitioning ATPase
MDLTAIVQRLDVTRALIEADVAVPAVIAVTSAARGDGKSLVAAGLAHGLAGVGHRVLLVDGNADGADVNPGGAPKLDLLPYDILQYVTLGLRGEPSYLRLVTPGVVSTCSVETVQATFARLRENFAYTIVDTAVLVQSGMAVALAGEADGVVIAFKQGRPALEADRDFVKVLRSLKTPVLGVVTAQPQAVRSFNAERFVNVQTNASRLRTVDDSVKGSGPIGIRLG